MAHCVTAATGSDTAAHRGGHHHDDFRHTRHMGRHRIHDQAGRVRGLAARHINAHAVQRRDLLTQQATVFIAVAPALAAGFFLGFVVAAHAALCVLQGAALGLGNAVEGSLEIGL